MSNIKTLATEGYQTLNNLSRQGQLWKVNVTFVMLSFKFDNQK